MSAQSICKILITGATGNIGRELTGYLASNNIPFRAMVRSLGTAGELANMKDAELVTGDFNNPASLEKAISGMEHAFLLTNSSELAAQQQNNFVEAAGKTGLRHIVKLSQWAADIHSPVRFLRYHAEVESTIKSSGISHTFLRPNLFMQGLLGFRETMMKQGKFFGAIADAKVSMVDTRDIALAAALSLTNPGHENKTYNLTGPQALSHDEMAEKLSNALGRTIRFIDVPPHTLLEMLLSAGFSIWQAEGLVEDYAHYARGEAAEVSSDFYNVTARNPTDFESFVRDFAPAFMG